jgi:hypothetical protein
VISDEGAVGPLEDVRTVVTGRMERSKAVLRLAAAASWHMHCSISKNTCQAVSFSKEWDSTAPLSRKVAWGTGALKLRAWLSFR